MRSQVAVADGVNNFAQVVAGDFHRHEGVNQRERLIKMVDTAAWQRKAVKREFRSVGGSNTAREINKRFASSTFVRQIRFLVTTEPAN
jgi:hypothetical protein